ncbi:carbon-phosphorus lyase complex subunit PhnI [Elioraea rosea]|uniref:carbon-phosphorus lyase complex subunit PhnI n=1 Tax=Elioraea rosea TaxID=2492390 RepID=UPI001185AB31|nr:carbon-phosphorus lyase complex subunit PhnI [Elioraea rosea]
MYVAVKGGEKAIENSHAFLAEVRRGPADVPALALEQIEGQLGLAVDRVMAEASLYDRRLAALAIRQAQGDLVEAAFLLRAYRTTLPRFGASLPLDTAVMAVERRVSATYKDLPGGQVLGPTYDYTHRLLDFSLEAGGETAAAPRAEAPLDAAMPHVSSLLAGEGLMRPEAPDDGREPVDITRDPPRFPADRSARLQALARGDEGFVLAMGYSTQRGYGGAHPFAGEIRYGAVTVELVPEELGFPIELGEIMVTECEMVNQFKGSRTEKPQFTRGYGLVFGHGERKAMGMALVDRALMAAELGEEAVHPAQDHEFVLSHCDNVESSGFVQHLKLPHYVDFQSELELIRRLRAEAEERLAETRREAAE